ncbi:MAG: hypothetical protein ACQEP6_01155 [Patescibacteria group bacterium]
MKKLYAIFGGLAVLASTPSVVSAQEFGDVDTLLDTILSLLDTIILIILALALVFFLWGVAKFILNAGDPEEQSKGKQVMFWGLIGLFVMTAVWGLVAFIQDQLGIQDDDSIEAPDRLQ